MERNETFQRLHREILSISGFRSGNLPAPEAGGLSLIKEAFPNNRFPVAAVHEFICSTQEEAAASSGFISGIVSSLMTQSGITAWIGSGGTVYPHALKLFGIEPDRIFFIEPLTEKEKLWTIEETLKCEGLTAVIADIREISFTNSRRLQLAVEQSGVTGFLLRRRSKNMLSCAVTQWQVQPAFSAASDDLPGLGFPQWNVQLLKVRNGKPGNWHIEWKSGAFHHIEVDQIPVQSRVRKVV